MLAKALSSNGSQISLNKSFEGSVEQSVDHEAKIVTTDSPKMKVVDQEEAKSESIKSEKIEDYEEEVEVEVEEAKQEPAQVVDEPK